MKIEILGQGCSRCRTLEANTREALEELGLDAEIEKVADIARITAYGVMSTPGMVVDGRVKGSGRIFSREEIVEMLREHEA
ncbi:MAG TPA: thioredoxin family protein [Thermodesulfobacteriaceae bacterium]|nr:thioredoxin family protein [Thermodesulfobacteriaceae bacterium]